MESTPLFRATLLGAMLIGGLAVTGCGDSAPASTSTTTEKTTIVVPATTPPKTEVSITTNPAPAPSAK